MAEVASELARAVAECVPRARAEGQLGVAWGAQVVEVEPWEVEWVEGAGAVVGGSAVREERAAAAVLGEAEGWVRVAAAREVA